MAQQLRDLAVLPMDLVLIPSTNMAAQLYCLAYRYQAHTWSQTYIQTKHSYAEDKIK